MFYVEVLLECYVRGWFIGVNVDINLDILFFVIYVV